MRIGKEVHEKKVNKKVERKEKIAVWKHVDGVKCTQNVIKQSEFIG